MRRYAPAIARHPLSFLPRTDFARGAVFSMVVYALICFSSGRFVLADDWPQVLGPNRDGTTLQFPWAPEKWPEKAKPQWEIELGSGFAGAAVMGDTVFIPHRKDDVEYLTAIELGTGRMLWNATWSASYQGTINPDSGPRAVPAIRGSRVVTQDAAGVVVCCSELDGEIHWKRELRKEYQGKDGYFGAGSSPLIVNDLVILCPGGKQAGIVALELDSGKTRWTATSYDSSYASPIAFQHGEEMLLLIVTRLNTVLLNARDGTLLGDVSFGSRGPTVNAATPIRVGKNRFLLTASYGIGVLLVDVHGLELSEVLRDRRLLASQYNSPVLVSGKLFGIHGREDMGGAGLRVLDVESRSTHWEKGGFGTAHLIGFEDQVLCLGLDGQLTLLDATADDYHPLGGMQLPTGTYRALPALAGRQLLVRSSDSPQKSRLMLVNLR